MFPNKADWLNMPALHKREAGLEKQLEFLKNK
jgi:hypothetical protein